MAVVSFFNNDQDDVFAEVERIIDQHVHPALQWFRDDLQRSNIDLNAILDRMGELLQAARRAQGRRIAADAAYPAEGSETRAAVDALDAWVRDFHQIIRTAEALGVPGATEVAGRVLMGTRMDNYGPSHGLTLGIFEGARAADAERVLGLPEGYLAQGEALLAKARSERVDAHQVEVTREFYADEIAEYIDQLAQEAEKIAQARKLVELRTGRKLPGFTLGYLRAAAARRKGLKVSVPEPEPEAPAADTATAGALPGLPGLT